MRRAALMLPLVLALAGCGGGSDESTAGGVTADEARQLNDAAASTDINASANVIDEAK
jgi:class 3 adenylate cyclase